MGERTERPILFSSAMVQAILAGRKTQTRRVVKPQPFGDMTNALTGVREWLWTKASRLLGRDTPLPIEQLIKFCPYGVPGDRLYVRETWRPETDWVGGDGITTQVAVRYRADTAEHDHWVDVPVEKRVAVTQQIVNVIDGQDGRWKPSIHMPRWASRITLEIEQVRVERIQEIKSPGDIWAEGVESQGGNSSDGPWRMTQKFKERWDALYAKKGCGWDANPFVWVLTFKRVPA